MRPEYRRLFYLLLLSVVFLPLFLPAQNLLKQDAGNREDVIRSIDSIIVILRKDSLPGDENFAIACKALRLSIGSSYTWGKAESYRLLGNHFVRKHKSILAIRFLLSSSHLFSTLKDTTGLMNSDHATFLMELYLKDYQNALSTASHGLELARQKKDMINTGIFLQCMAGVFGEQKDTARSLDYYQESLKYFRDEKSRNYVLNIYMSIGGIYLDQKRYADVIKMYDTLVKKAESIDPTSAGTMYTRLAHVYDQQKNYARAVYYNRKAYNIRKKSGFSELENSSVINLAGDFFKMNQLDSAWYYINKGIADAKRNKRTYYLRNSYGILYDFYLKKGNEEKALENFKLMTAMNDSILNERLNTDINVIRTGQNILTLKEGIRQLERQNALQRSFIRNQKIFKILLSVIVLALFIAVGVIVTINIRHRRSKKNIEKLNVKLRHEAAERKLVQRKTAEKDEQYRFIAEHSLDLISRIDKNYNFTYASPAAEEIFGYSTKELLSFNLFDLVIPGYKDSLKEQLQKVVSTRRPFSIAFLAKRKGNETIWVENTVNPVFDAKTGIFREFVSVTRNIQELKKREMGIVEGTKQKENLLREIHHRVKNNFAILVSLINMQKSQSQNDDVKQSLTNLQLRIRTMALVHEMLYRSEDFEKISFPDYIRSVASVISATYGRMNVDLEFQMEPVVINIETAIPLGLILNELLSNAYRHAFDENSRGAISISFKRHETPNMYALCISDSGKGLPEGFSMEGSKTMGLQIVDILVKQIEAHLQIVQTSGTSFTIIFPLEA